VNASRERHRTRSRHAQFFLRCCALALLATLFIIRIAAAQALSGDERTRLEARKDALFQQMLHNPANLDVTFAYADVSARLGDYEAAVSALDRMLLFNPSLPRVDLELGALYFRMGSYDLARDYFGRALAANPPTEVRARIDEYDPLAKTLPDGCLTNWLLSSTGPIGDRISGDPGATLASL